MSARVDMTLLETYYVEVSLSSYYPDPRVDSVRFSHIDYAINQSDNSISEKENEMNAKIEGNELVVRLPLVRQTSKSGKSLVIATTGGNQPTTAQFEGKTVILGLNAYVKP